MDIFNQPPSISEDTVIYALYPPVGYDRSAVTSLLTLIYTFVQDELLPVNHIWHRDSFDLRVIDDNPSGNARGVKKRGSSGSDSSGPDLRMEGTMRVGDCVDDEWLVVWLLYRISERFDVVIRSVYSTGSAYPSQLRDHGLASAACTTRMGSFFSSRQPSPSPTGSHQRMQGTG